MSTENNRRIAKNTIMLYFRMILTMIVSLYTSRVVLNTLGVEDFGIYNVVGGFVTMFGFLNSAMASATQRFLAVEIGRNDKRKLQNVFSMSINIHVLIIFLIFIVAETFGLWFVNSQLTIDPERIEAARWVYHFSILTLMVNMVSVPYNAMIISHERMNVFAWVSIAEVSLKLLIVYTIVYSGFDKLKIYAILMFGLALLISMIYRLYCYRKFTESRFRLYWDKPLFKTLFNYAGWNLWGNAAGVIMGQGVNILLNIFFGPVVNAARGIAFQVKSAVEQFTINFQMAFNPQIIKSYAANDLKYMHQLIIQGSKYSFFLLFALSLPILLETESILKLWLKIVPEYTIIFTKLVIINMLLDSISGPLMTAAQASGKIKFYQATVGGLLILNLPVSYLFLKFHYPPETTLYVSVFISIISFFARLVIISPLVNIRIFMYIKKVVFNIIPVAIIASIFSTIINSLLSDGFERLIITGFTSILTTVLTVYCIGIGKEERLFVNRKLKHYLLK